MIVAHPKIQRQLSSCLPIVLEIQTVSDLSLRRTSDDAGAAGQRISQQERSERIAGSGSRKTTDRDHW